MKIVPAYADVFPNVAAVQEKVLKLKPMMTGLNKADIHRLESAAKAAPRRRRSNRAPSKMRNAADMTFQNVTLRRNCDPAKRDRSQSPSAKPNKKPSEESAEASTKRGARRRSNAADAASAPASGLMQKPKSKNVSVNVPADSGPWLRPRGPDGAVANITSSELGARQPSKKPADNVEPKQDRDQASARKKPGKRGRRKKRADAVPAEMRDDKIASEPNTVVQRAGRKATTAANTTNERPRRNPRMSLLPGDKPEKDTARTTKKGKAGAYVVPLVRETRALKPAEIIVLMRKNGLNAISENQISPEVARMLKKPSKKAVQKGSCQCIDGCKDCNCIKNCRYTADGRLDERFLDAKTIIECGGSCGCDRRCRNRATQRDPCPYPELIVTPDKGIGVRATNAIPMHAFVMEYLGEVIPYSKTRRTAEYVFGLTGLWGEEAFFIDAERHFNKSRFINHSCDPNLIARYVYTADKDRRIPRIVFFAKREIEDGEQLSFDYHEGMSAEELEKEFRGHLQDCLCGAGEKCRGKL